MRRGLGIFGAGTIAALAAAALLSQTDARADTASFVFSGCSVWIAPANVSGTVGISATGSGGQAGGSPRGGYGDEESASLSNVHAGDHLDVCVNVGGGAPGSGPGPTGAGGGASGVSLGSDFSQPIVVAGGGGGGPSCCSNFLVTAGHAGMPVASSGFFAGGCCASPGAGGNNTTQQGGAGGAGAQGGATGGDGAKYTPAGPGQGGAGGNGDYSAGAGAGGGYFGGGGGGGGSGQFPIGGGGGGGTDFCGGNNVSGCTTTSGAGTAFGAGGASTLAHVDLTYTILQTQSINFPSINPTYGDPDLGPATATSALPVTYSNPSGQCSVSGGGLTIHINGAGSCTITANQAGGNGYAAASPVASTFSINMGTLHIDASSTSRMYGGSDPPVNGVFRSFDFRNGDTALSSSITGAANCAIATHSENVGLYPSVILCGPGTLAAPNYTFTAGNPAGLTIIPATVHVDANSASKAYGGADPAPGATLRVADFRNGDTPSTSSITGAAFCEIGTHSQNAGLYPGVISCGAALLSAPNYIFAVGNAANLTITQVVTVPVPATGAGSAAPGPDAGAGAALLIVLGSVTTAAGARRRRLH